MTTAERPTTAAPASAASRTGAYGHRGALTGPATGARPEVPHPSTAADAADHGTIACFTGLVAAAVVLMVLTFAVPVPATARMVVVLCTAVGVGALTACLSQRLEERAARD